MNAKFLKWALLFLLMVPAITVRAQQTDVDTFNAVKTKAEKGDAFSQCALGEFYANGTFGVAQNIAEAVKWYRRAAEQNQAEAQYNLGICYSKGEGVVEDQMEALKWYRKAAEQNCAEAQHGLGVCYANGDGVTKDAAEAAKWYRKAADQNFAQAQYNLGICYRDGIGVAKDEAEEVKWYQKAAEQRYAPAQCNLGECYDNGEGVTKDAILGVKWYRKAAAQNNSVAQYNLGNCYYTGDGVPKNGVEAVNWWRKAAEQNYVTAQYNLGNSYYNGNGVVKDRVEAYKWWLLAAAQGNEDAKRNMAVSEQQLMQEQIAEGQKLARDFKPKNAPELRGLIAGNKVSDSIPAASGTGFFITDDGYLISNYHVVKDAAKVRLQTKAGLIDAAVVKVDAANDLALLKATGKYSTLPIAASRMVKLGSTVATVGFPDIGLQGFAPKLAKGEIASLAGAVDDPRYFQISLPVQHGNSGGALVDVHGNVVGIVAAKLGVEIGNAVTSDELPENVNYAVKSSLLLSFLESVPEVSAKLKEPKSLQTATPPFEDVVKSAQDAAVLVLVY